MREVEVSALEDQSSFRVFHLDNSNLGQYFNLADIRAATPPSAPAQG